MPFPPQYKQITSQIYQTEINKLTHSTSIVNLTASTSVKGKGLPQQAEVSQGVPGRLRPRIFVTFGTTRVVGRRYPRRNPWYSFLKAGSTPEHVVP